MNVLTFINLQGLNVKNKKDLTNNERAVKKIGMKTIVNIVKRGMFTDRQYEILYEIFENENKILENYN